MPPQNTHEIFRKELELFREKFPEWKADIGNCIARNSEIRKTESFLFASLRRASLAVVEESVGEELERLCSIHPKTHEKDCDCEDCNWRAGSNARRLETLATARTIVGEE